MFAHDVCAPVRRTTYSLNFLFSFVGALITYFITPLLLSRHVPENWIGPVFAIEAFASVITLFVAPWVLTRLGNYRTFIALSAWSVLGLALLAFVPDTAILVTVFVLYSATTAVLYLILDMVLEGSMPAEGVTGGTRGAFITLGELAWFIGPVLAGWIMGVGSFELLFIIAAALTVPAISIAHRRLSTIRAHVYHMPRLYDVIQVLARNKDLRGVFAAQFLLRIFYAMMVIYLPLYLIEHVGVSFTTFGAILSTAMLAYLIFEWPAGLLADRRFGEKEIMATGFVIMAVTTTALSFGIGTSVLLWGAILFCTRVGASFVDITTETYFFKKVDGDNADTVSLFRMLGPIAYIGAPIVGISLSLFIPLQFLFVGFGILMLLGVPFALSITDTR